MNKTFWIHLPVGIINGSIAMVDSLYGLTCALGFMLYETLGMIGKKDKAWLDVQGWLVGLYVVGVCWIALEVFG